MASYRISTAGVDEGASAARRGRAAGEAASRSSAAGSGYRSSRDSGVFFYSQPQLSSTAPVTRDNKQRASILNAELAVPASERPPSAASPVRLLAIRRFDEPATVTQHTVPSSGNGTGSSGGDRLTDTYRPHNNHTNKGLVLDNLPESSVDPHPPDRPQSTPPPPPRRTKRNRNSSSSSSSSSSFSSPGGPAALVLAAGGAGVVLPGK